MVMWKMVLSVRCLVVLLFRCLVVSTNLLQYCQTTRQQNNKSVWKTVPSEARVTRDEVSGLIDRKEASVWKTVPFSIRKKKQQRKIRLKK